MSWPRVFSLIACNLIWAVQPVFGKLMLEEVTPRQLAWMRFATGALAYLILALALRLARRPGGHFYRPRGKVEWVSLLTIGLISFTLAPLLQTSGLASSQAVDSVIIVAMEPVIAVVLAWLILKERLGERLAVCLAVSTSGFALLSMAGPVRAEVAAWSHWQANVIILLSVAGEGVFSIAGRKLLDRGRPAFGVFGTGICIGAAVLTLVLLATDGLPDPRQLSGLAWFGAFWMGALGTTLGYAWWLKLLETEKVGTLVISLFLQPVAGSIAGMAYLGETLSRLQWVGAALILTGVVASTRIDTNIRE